MTVTKFNSSTVKTGREIAGDIKTQLGAGKVHIDTIELAQAKSILGDLQKMKGSNPSQKGSLTKTINTLNDAIKQGELKNLATNLTDIRGPGGPGGPGAVPDQGGTARPSGRR